jgi:branched-chain amino acid transport system substrate-binding protein
VSHRLRTQITVGVALGALLLATSGCGSDEAADGVTTYKVGFAAIKSGPAAFAGIPLAEGAELAAAEINETGYFGPDTKLELDVQDAGGDPAKGIAIVREFNANKVSGVLCCGLSSEAGALKPILEQAKVPGIVTSAILPGLAAPPYLYRPVILPEAPGGLYEQFTKAVVETEKPKTVAIAVTGDNDGMVADAKVWESRLKENGVQVVGTVSTSAKDTDYTGPATQIINLKPDMVVSSTLGQSTALLAKTLRERGYTNRIISSYGASNAANFKVAGAGLKGVTFVTPFAPGMTEPTALRFIDLYQKKHNKEPDIYAAQGYTAMWLLATGIKNAGSGEAAKVADALSKITEFDSVYGKLTFQGGQANIVGKGVYLQWTDQGTLVPWPNG